MKRLLCISILSIICNNTYALNNKCTDIKLLTSKYSNQYNEITQKTIELQNYHDQQQKNKYYPSKLTKRQIHQYLIELLEKTPINQIDAGILIHAIGSCDFENINLYLDYGLSLKCYTQEGDSNILNFLTHCRVQSEAKRNQVLERLLQAGANPNEGKKDLERDAAGSYPIAEANEACDASMLDILLKYGANPNLKTKGEEYFPILNICSGRNYSGLELPPDLEYPPTPTMPLAHILQSLLEHGADPNTIYITDDQRNYATQDREQILKIACSGKDEKAKSVYDLYAHEFAEAKTEGDPVKISNFQKLIDVLVKYEAKPLIDLCHTPNEKLKHPK